MVILEPWSEKAQTSGTWGKCSSDIFTSAHSEKHVVQCHPKHRHRISWKSTSHIPCILIYSILDSLFSLRAPLVLFEGESSSSKFSWFMFIWLCLYSVFLCLWNFVVTVFSFLYVLIWHLTAFWLSLSMILCSSVTVLVFPLWPVLFFPACTITLFVRGVPLCDWHRCMQTHSVPLIRIYGASEIFLVKFGEFATTISSSFLPAPLSDPSSGTLSRTCWCIWGRSKKPLFFHSSDCMISVDLFPSFSGSFFCRFKSVAEPVYWNFHIKLCVF